MAGRFHPNRRRTYCSRRGACVSIAFACTLLVSLSIHKSNSCAHPDQDSAEDDCVHSTERKCLSDNNMDDGDTDPCR